MSKIKLEEKKQKKPHRKLIYCENFFHEEDVQFFLRSDISDNISQCNSLKTLVCTKILCNTQITIGVLER